MFALTHQDLSTDWGQPNFFLNPCTAPLPPSPHLGRVPWLGLRVHLHLRLLRVHLPLGVEVHYAGSVGHGELGMIVYLHIVRCTRVLSDMQWDTVFSGTR